MTTAFDRFFRREGIERRALCEAVRRIAGGLIDADLGGGVFKQRVARPGQGKSGGVRVILALRRGAHVFFLHGFAKSDRENLRRADLEAVRKLADKMLRLDEAALDAMVTNRNIIEVVCHD